MKLGITARFVLSVFTFLAPMAVLFYFNLDQVSGNIHFVSQEIEGNQYQRILVGLMGTVSEHELLAAASKRTPGTYEAPVTELATDIATRFDALAAIEKKNEVDLQFTEAALKAADLDGLRASQLRSKWDTLLAGAGRAEAADRLKAYQALIGDIRKAISHVSDTSNLSLDPEMDSYYLSDIISNLLPEQIATQFASQKYLASLLGAPELTGANKTELVVYERSLKSADFGRVVGDLEGAVSENPKSAHGASETLQASLERILPDYQRDLRAYFAVLNGAAAGTPLADGFVAAEKSALQTSVVLADTAAKELDTLFQKRSNDFHYYRLKLTTMTLVALGIASLIFIFVLRSIVTPLKRIEQTMMRLAQNDLEIAVPYLNKADEIGRMAKSVEVFRRNGLERVQLEVQAKEVEALAEQDKQLALRNLVDDFEGNVQGQIDSISSTSAMLDEAAHDLQAVMRSVAGQSHGVVGASEETAQHVRDVSESVEQISTSAGEIARKVGQSAAVVGNAVAKMQEADQIASGLSQAVGEISAVLQLISAVAGQTNLLALNATIEAARAGEAGKGFAVVASEVKNLAGQTTKATEEIASNIRNVEKASTDVVKILGLIRGAIDDISAYSNGIASAAEEQSATTYQISGRMQNAMIRVNDITTNIATVTRGVAKADQTSTDVLSAVQTLSSQSDLLNVQVRRFLGGLRH
jgi:methyl-accepting chemotaxis protein